MKRLGIYEELVRGTPDFPLGYYRVDNTHPNYHMQLHWHVEYELIRVRTGELTLYLDEETHCCKTGDCVLIAGSTLHGATPRECVYECAVFDTGGLFQGKFRAELERIGGFVPLPQGGAPNVAAQAFFETLNETEEEFLILGSLYRFFGILRTENCYRPDQNAGSKKIRRLKLALRRIETDYASTVTLSELAGECGMTPKYFCRFFKEMTQRTPIDYLNHYRVKIACEMLRENRESVTEIALSCGFNDLSYFIKTFKRYQGVSPKGYLKQYQKQEEEQ